MDHAVRGERILQTSEQSVERENSHPAARDVGGQVFMAEFSRLSLYPK